MTEANYKPGTVCRFMPYTDRKCQSQAPAWIYTSPPLTSHCFPAHSLVLSVSIRLPSSFSPLHCSGMCISAVSDESVVYRALLCACVCIFMYHVLTCREETRTVSRKTGNYPPRSWKMGLFQLLSRLYPTKYPHLVPNSA